MCYVNCNYKKFATPEGFLYETLSNLLTSRSFRPFLISSLFPSFHPKNLTPALHALEPSLQIVALLQGLANRTAEKVKPSALDMMLLFRESVRIKQVTPGGKKAALRDVLFGAIAEYNKSIANHRVSWLKKSAFYCPIRGGMT